MAKMAVYKIVKGQRVQLTAREQKAYVMKQKGISSAEYKKQYDIFKNKLRAYEAYQRAHGVDVKKQSASELIYKHERAKAREGAEFTPSLEWQRINRFTSVSSGRKGQEALKGSRYMEARRQEYEATTMAYFKDFIKNNDGAQKIYQSVGDPVKREKALAEYADFIKAKQKADGSVDGEAVAEESEVYGSDTFDEAEVADIINEYA